MLDEDPPQPIKAILVLVGALLPIVNIAGLIHCSPGWRLPTGDEPAAVAAPQKR